MGQRITINQNNGSKGTSILVCVANTSGFLKTFANSAVSNTTHKINVSGETVSKTHIAYFSWSGAAGSTVTLLRGGNTVFKGTGTGERNFFENQIRLESPTGGDAQANVVFTTSGDITFIIKLHKTSGE